MTSTTHTNQRFVRPRFVGRLGNQAFTLAAAIAYGCEHARTLLLDVASGVDSTYLSDAFAGVSCEKKVANDLKVTTLQETSFQYDKLESRDTDDDIVELSGHFQSYLYFNEFRAEILRAFTPSDAVRAKLRVFFEKLQTVHGADCAFVSVHVRRGDYLHLQHIYHVQPATYFTSGMDMFLAWHSQESNDSQQENARKLLFIVFSDDIEWCKQNFSAQKYNLRFVGDVELNGIESMHAMAQCDAGNIIANSSLSWWGAYLNQNRNARVVAPLNWFKFRSPRFWQDLYCNGWIVLSPDGTSSVKSTAFRDTSTPLYSFIVTTYECRGKGCALLTENLRAALQQTYRPLQVVISDHSRDDCIEHLVTETFLKEAEKKRIELRYTRCAKDYGSPCTNWNHGFTHSSGEIVQFFAMDDYLATPSAIAEIVKYMKEQQESQQQDNVSDGYEGKDALWIACAHKKCGEEICFVPYWNDNVLEKNTLSGPSAIVLHRALAQHVQFDKQFVWNLDLDWYYRLFRFSGQEAVCFSSVCWVNRHHADQLTNAVCSAALQKDEETKLFRKYGFPLPLSIRKRYAMQPHIGLVRFSYGSESLRIDVSKVAFRAFITDCNISIPSGVSFNNLFGDVHCGVEKTLKIVFSDASASISLSENRTRNFEMRFSCRERCTSRGQKEQQYYSLVRQIPQFDGPKTFRKSGKLVIALFEFRAIEEILHCVDNILRVYHADEIGLAIVFGTQNQQYIESRFSSWKNLMLVNTGDYNHDAYSYSQRLQTPELWERFAAFEHVLVTQCDALLLRKIPDVYFQYDYIGAPWKNSDLAGNGGFSLRRVSAMVRACEPFRGKALCDVPLPHTHEDGFFCRQDNMVYPKDRALHESFSIESVYNKNPVGLHKCYNWIEDEEEWQNITDNIAYKLLQ